MHGFRSDQTLLIWLVRWLQVLTNALRFGGGNGGERGGGGSGPKLNFKGLSQKRVPETRAPKLRAEAQN